MNLRSLAIGAFNIEALQADVFNSKSVVVHAVEKIARISQDQKKHALCPVAPLRTDWASCMRVRDATLHSCTYLVTL